MPVGSGRLATAIPARVSASASSSAWKRLPNSSGVSVTAPGLVLVAISSTSLLPIHTRRKLGWRSRARLTCDTGSERSGRPRIKNLSTSRPFTLPAASIALVKSTMQTDHRVVLRRIDRTSFDEDGGPGPRLAGRGSAPGERRQLAARLSPIAGAVSDAIGIEALVAPSGHGPTPRSLGAARPRASWHAPRAPGVSPFSARAARGRYTGPRARRL